MRYIRRKDRLKRFRPRGRGSKLQTKKNKITKGAQEGVRTKDTFEMNIMFVRTQNKNRNRAEGGFLQYPVLKTQEATVRM
jgi:hypothetical protein